MFVHDHFSFSRSCPKYTTSQGFASNEQRRDCFATYLFTVPLIAFPPRYPCVPPPEAQGQAVAPGAQVQAVSLSFRLRNSPTSLKGSNSETMTVLTRKTQHFKLQNCQYAKSARNLHPKNSRQQEHCEFAHIYLVMVLMVPLCPSSFLFSSVDARSSPFRPRNS